MRNLYSKGINRVIGVFCALVLLVSALYVPMVISAAGPVNSVDIKDGEAVLFDFENIVTDSAANEAQAKGEAGIGYYGWGWKVNQYTDGDKTNTVLDASKNDASQSWSTGGGYRLHTKKADGTYGFYALEGSTKYMVSFKIRVLSSPVTVTGSAPTATATLDLAYNMTYLFPSDWAPAGSFINYIEESGKIPVMSSLIDSNKFVLYDSDGNSTEYPCSEEWHTVTYFINTPASFKYDNAIGFYTDNYHGGACEIDDVSITKIGANSGVITLYDEYSDTKEYFIGKDGEELDLTKFDISDRANETTHKFEGWCKDEARTEKIEKIAFVKGEDTYVYSRWDAPVVVTFKNLLDGSESKITGVPGDSFEYPKDPVDPENKSWFMGWYKDEVGTVAHTSGKFSYANETIYAYFKGEIVGLTQDFENYTRDAYTVKTDANGQNYKSNRNHFAPTMAKQSNVTMDGSGYAIKYHWNPVQIDDKNNENYYDTSRWATANDNIFNLGDGLENNTVYVVTLNYLAEKASAPVKFLTASADWDNIWAHSKDYSNPETVTLETDGKWHQYSFQFTTDYAAPASDEIFLMIGNTANVETILYIDNVEIKAYAQPYETVATINTGVSNKVVYAKGNRGDKIVLPQLTHPDGAPFKGFYLDKEFTVPFEQEVYDRHPITLYVKWGAFAMTFEEYLYEGSKANDPGITRVNEKGIGNGDDYAMHFVVDRKEDTNIGTPSGLLIAEGIQNGEMYKVRYDYKVDSANNLPLSISIRSVDQENVWWPISYSYTYTDTKITNGEANLWQTVEVVFLANVQADDSYKGFADDLVLSFNGQNYKAGEKVSVYIDNVLVEETDMPVVFFNGQNGRAGSFVEGNIGDEIKFPTVTHPDGAKFLGWYTDLDYTTRFTETKFTQDFTVVYAKWSAAAMTFKEYPYEADNWKDPYINRVNESGIGNGDDYAMQWFIDRKVDDTSNVGTSSAFRIAADIQHDAIYRVKFDYKTSSKTNKPLTVTVLSADKENIWWNISHSYPHTTLDIDAGGTNGWKSYECYIRADVWTNESYGGVSKDLYLALGGKTGKAGEYIDLVIDNVLVEEADMPVIIFNGQNGRAGSFVEGELGEEIKFPTVTHPDGAKFLGWYTDEKCTTRFTGTTFTEQYMMLYAKWSPVAMTFKDYAFEGDYWKDPNINRVTEKGIGNGDDYAMRWFVDRKVTDTSNVGTAQRFRVAKDIEDGAVYRVKYDYKASSKQSVPLTLSVSLADSDNIWWAITHSYSYTKIDIPVGGTKGWQTNECYFRADVRSDESYGGITTDLYLAFSGQTYKAGEYIDVLIDNVLIEKIEEPPYVFFDGVTFASFSQGKVGDKIEYPTTIPARVGYDFAGWYSDPELKNKFDLKTFEADTAVVAYAKWTEASTYVYSFEDYTCKEGINYTHERGVLATNIKKSGKYSMAFGKDDPEGEGGVFALEDGGVFYNLKTGGSYILKLNYYIKEHSDVNLGVRFVAAYANNYYIAITNGSTGLTPTFMITAEQAKEQKGKWQTMTFVLDTTKLSKNEDGTDLFTQLYCFLSSGKGWEIYFDDIAITAVPKGKVAVSFQTEGVKGCPDYLIGKPGQSYADKVPEVLTKEGKLFKGYFTKDANGSFLEKERTNMVFGEASETLFARFLDYEINENFDEGFYEKAYGKGLGYTIHDFDYEVYDSEKEGNSKENVTSGRYSLHRKGNSMYKENSVILTLGNQIAEGERYTVTFKVKMGKHFHTDGAVKLVSSRSFQYAWTTTGDYYPVIAIADLADGQWHEVSYTFNSVEAFVTVQTPGYVELFMDDFKFTLVDEKTPLSEPIQFTEYVAAKRDANGNLVKKDRNNIDVSTIIDDSLSANSFPWLYVGIGAGVLVIGVAVVLILFVFKKKKA